MINSSTFVNSFDFVYPKLSRVCFRSGAAVSEPPQQLRAWQVSCTIVVVNRSLAETEPVAQLMQALVKVGVSATLFSRNMQRCPLATAVELAQLASDRGAQVMIAIGGSSVSDTAKAANLVSAHLMEGAQPSTETIKRRWIRNRP